MVFQDVHVRPDLEGLGTDARSITRILETCPQQADPGGSFPRSLGELSDDGGLSDPVNFFVSYTSADRPWAEWIAWQLEDAGQFKRDPTGRDRRLIPVRVRACEPDGLLGAIVYVDLVGLEPAPTRLSAGFSPSLE